MSELTSFEQNLKNVYLNYEKGDLNESLNGLDRMLDILFENDTESDPFWKQEAGNVFKAVILNNFYNKKEMTLKDLGLLFANLDEMRKNITEFGSNFKDNNSINFINTINISDNTLKSVMEILQKNVSELESDNVENLGENKNRGIEITRDNYKNYDYVEGVLYDYRGLGFECDHEYDAGVFMVWLHLPKLPDGLKYKYGNSDDGDVPYKHEFDAGYLSSGPFFTSAVKELMDYVDEYYEYFNPEDKAVSENSANNSSEDINCFACGNIIKMDWSKIPNTEKIVYIKCPKCGSELKRGNPNFIENDSNK